MELESTIVTINNLLKLNFDDHFKNFIHPPKQIISIPDYQREYKWEKAKIKTFVDNVMQRSKFLGIITVEVPNQPYLSLVDGQQRLTTMMLMFAQLYNACADEDETETQTEIQDLIACQINGQLRFRLENGSVGEYLHFITDEDGKQRISLKINDAVDIYKQSNKFADAWATISREISEIRQRNPDVTLDVYKQQLLDCEVLLFAQKNTANLQQGSSEEIYIDINEKAQKLDPEDIFKGHCFAICKTCTQQNQVKVLWRSIKQKFFSMDQIFKKADMGIFLHYYLLTQEATKNPRQDIKKDLTINGENVITQRYNTPTKAINLLKDMEIYQANLLEFVSKLKIANYDFSDIMTASPQDIGNNRERINEFCIILKKVISCNQNLFKLPLFYLIDQNFRKEAAEKLSYTQFAKFTCLYYIYMFLFSRLGGSKKRGDLANGLICTIQSNENFLVQFVKEIKDYGEGFNVDIDDKAIRDTETRKELYSILDSFKVTSNHTPVSCDADFSLKLKLFPSSYNIEHLIVNQSHKILWKSAQYSTDHPDSEFEYTFDTNDLRTCRAWIGQNNCWANFIWIDEIFNRDYLKNKDIINKIILLRGSCIVGNAPNNETYAKKHPHIETICQHIMQTNGFQELLTAYSNDASRATVLDRYKTFIDNYFSEDNLEALRIKFKDQFVGKLENLYQIIQ